MTLEAIKTVIKEGQEDLLTVQLYERPFEFEEEGRYVLVGIRQAGKSYLLYQRARHLLSQGHSISEIVYINFDDERLLGMTAQDLDLVLQAYNSMFSGKPILFFDEIQNIAGWEHFARRLANQKYLVFITGSNARMLSRDIASTLGARYFDEKVFPYSFREFLGAQNIVLEANWNYGQQRGLVQQKFEDYIRWGGFPELLLYHNKRHWLNGLYEKIILGDVIQRNKVRNEQALRLAVKRLAESVMHPVSYNRLTNMVKSVGVSTNVASVIEYITYVKNACLMFDLGNYASKFSERESVKKHYFTDNGLLSIFLNDEKAQRLENLCAIALQKKYNADEDSPGLYYWSRTQEVDFYVPDENYAVQACCNLADYETREREISALAALHKEHPLSKAQIISLEDETQILKDDLVIEVIPAWKWLLSQ